MSKRFGHSQILSWISPNVFQKFRIRLQTDNDIDPAVCNISETQKFAILFSANEYETLAKLMKQLSKNQTFKFCKYWKIERLGLINSVLWNQKALNSTCPEQAIYKLLFSKFLFWVPNYKHYPVKSIMFRDFQFWTFKNTQELDILVLGKK